MPQTIQHLTTTKAFSGDKNQEYSIEIISQFVEGCKKLDANIIEKTINEDDVFENKSKYQFLADLKELFDIIKSKKTSRLNVTVTDSHCQGCSFGKPIKIFSVNEIGKSAPIREFAFAIDVEKGVLKDIYQCNLFY